MPLGGGAPISVQSMTSTHTRDVDATVAQIQRLTEAGADLVRVAVPEEADTIALRAILRQVSVPIIADVHYRYERALDAVEAGVHKIRLNPGNLKERRQIERVIAVCRERGVPIRIGVNEGSLIERADAALRAQQQSKLAGDRRGGLVELMVETLADYLRIFEENDFNDLVLAAKSPDAALVIELYLALSDRFDYPLHVGVTHAGPRQTASIRSVAAIGTLLAEGIGDTIRISYADDPVYEVEDAKELLCALGLRARTEPELIACPTCGRLEIDLVKLTSDVQERLKRIKVPLKVAVMGCVVNGPGEAEGADVALCAGKGKAIIYVHGQRKRIVSEAEMLDALYAECVALAEAAERGSSDKP